jgi:hypothetical protein
MNVMFLTGSGAVKGSWAPVFAALARCAPSGAKLAEYDAANTLMATAVHAARFGHRFNAEKPERQRELLGPRNAIRDEIVAELRSASLEPQPEFGDVWRAFIPRGACVHVATTNWDDAIDRWLGTKTGWSGDVLHVHGAAASGGSGTGEIYLPSETCFEPYFTDETTKRLLASLHQYQGALKAADRLVIYGLALSPLDAELCLWLSQSLDETLGKVRQVFVVNTDPNPVIRRLRAISFENTRADVIQGYVPTALPGIVPG